MKKKDLKEDNSKPEQKGKKYIFFSDFVRKMKAEDMQEMLEEYGEVYVLSAKTRPFKVSLAELS